MKGSPYKSADIFCSGAFGFVVLLPICIKCSALMGASRRGAALDELRPRDRRCYPFIGFQRPPRVCGNRYIKFGHSGVLGLFVITSDLAEAERVKVTRASLGGAGRARRCGVKICDLLRPHNRISRALLLCVLFSYCSYAHSSFLQNRGYIGGAIHRTCAYFHGL